MVRSDFINRELDADFPVDSFRHEARWNPKESRMEMHLVTDAPLTVAIPGAGIEVNFTAGESIHTENSYKFTPMGVAEMLRHTGYHSSRQWMDSASRFLVTLATV